MSGQAADGDYSGDFIDDVERMLGRDVADRLLDAFGGATVYVPAPDRLRDTSPLCVAIGRDAALKVCAMMVIGTPKSLGGVQVKIPLRHAGARARLHAEMARLIGSGMSAPTIAKELKVDEKTVRRHRARIKDKARAARAKRKP